MQLLLRDDATNANTKHLITVVIHHCLDSTQNQLCTYNTQCLLHTHTLYP